MYLEIDDGFVGHPKTRRLKARMRDKNALAYLIKLWSWACRSATDGDLTGMSPEEIEDVCEYSKMDGKLYEALRDINLIDEIEGQPASIHNWKKRTGKRLLDWDAARESDKLRKQAARAARKAELEALSAGRPTGQERTSGSPGSESAPRLDKARQGKASVTDKTSTSGKTENQNTANTTPSSEPEIARKTAPLFEPKDPRLDWFSAAFTIWVSTARPGPGFGPEGKEEAKKAFLEIIPDLASYEIFQTDLDTHLDQFKRGMMSRAVCGSFKKFCQNWVRRDPVKTKTTISSPVTDEVPTFD